MDNVTDSSDSKSFNSPEKSVPQASSSPQQTMSESLPARDPRRSSVPEFYQVHQQRHKEDDPQNNGTTLSEKPSHDLSSSESTTNHPTLKPQAPHPATDGPRRNLPLGKFGKEVRGAYDSSNQKYHTDHGPRKPKPFQMTDAETCGDYIIMQRIGKGAKATVYRGLHRKRGHFVAIKKVLINDKTRMQEKQGLMMEFKLLQPINHPNIVKYLDHIWKKDQLYFVMECMEGSLKDFLKKHGVPPENLIRKNIHQILEGLVYLHDQGVIHRDIKCANILISIDGSVKLADFGLAGYLSELLARDQQDDDNLGSPYWLAPEIIMGPRITPACISGRWVPLASSC